MDFCWKVMSLVFDMLSRFVIGFLPRSKCLLISWLQSPSAVILEPKKIKSVNVSIGSPCICHQTMGWDAMILGFWMLSFKPSFSLSSFTSIKRFFNSSLLSAIRVMLSAYLRLLILLLAFLIPTSDSSRQAFHIMYSTYKSNKQGDNIQPYCTPFPTLNQSIVPCPVLTAASWSVYWFCRCDTLDRSLPGFSIHGIFQARIPEWVAISFSRDLPDPGIKHCLPHCRQTLYPLSYQHICNCPTLVGQLDIRIECQRQQNQQMSSEE